MDVTLVLTHRCNLDCTYCYAGEHHRTDMDDATVDEAVDLLFSDGCDEAQLSFFGGEPFLARDAMERAVARATWRAEQAGARLNLQCTTNGAALRSDDIAYIRATDMRVTVSIDGVREAHDVSRPRAGGASSFDQVHGGLRQLVAAGARPQAMMVITPATVPFVYRSVCWLWDEGVRRVLANIDLTASWDDADRHELEQELLTVGWELMARHSRGERVEFDPFGDMAAGDARQRSSHAAPERQVVVATGGNLYPCAPMVGDDRDTPERQRVRMGSLADGPEAIAARVNAEGTRCNSGGACECAAFLETGDRMRGGSMGMWYGRTTREIGASISAGIEADRRRAALGVDDEETVEEKPPLLRRRGFLAGLAVAAGGVALGGAAYLARGIGERQDRVAGELGASPYVETETPGGCPPVLDAEIDTEGIQMTAGLVSPKAEPPEPPPRDPKPVDVDDRRPAPGRLARPKPPPPPEAARRLETRGQLRARGPRPKEGGEH